MTKEVKDKILGLSEAVSKARMDSYLAQRAAEKAHEEFTCYLAELVDETEDQTVNLVPRKIPA